MISLTSCGDRSVNSGDIFINYSGTWNGTLNFDDTEKSAIALEVRIVHTESFFNGVFKWNNQNGELIAHNIDGIFTEFLVVNPADSTRYLLRGTFRNSRITGNWFLANNLNPDDRGPRQGNWSISRPVR